MPYYLADHEGRGTRKDPGRPVAALDHDGWSQIDLGDVSFLHLPDHDRRLRKLCDDRRERPGRKATNTLVDRLGAQPGRLDVMIARLLRHPPDGRWNPLQPTRRGAYEVWLGGERIYWEPVIRGGATDNFNRSNETPLASPWVKLNGSNVNLTSNALVKSASSDNTFYYYSGAVTSADQYSQAVEVSGGSDWAVAVRISGGSGTENAYFLDPYAFGNLQVLKYVAGSFFTVGNTSMTYAIGNTIRLEVEGTALQVERNGSNPGAGWPATDTSIANGDVGLWMYAAGVSVDDWEGGDLNPAAPTTYTKTGKGVIG